MEPACARWDRHLAACFLAGAVVAGVGADLPAGTIRHDRNDADYRALANQPQFASVGRYDRFSSGGLIGSLTLIHPNWALTAAHVVDNDFDGDLSNNPPGYVKVGGYTRQAAEIIVPTGVNGNPGWNGSIGDGFDIALVRFNEPILDITPARIYSSFQELGKVVTMVGYGQTGDGTTGSTGSSGTKRAGQNVVDELFTMRNGATALRWDFDEPAPRKSPNQLGGSSVPLDLEYQIASGDSGGGSFIFEDGVWWLAGVHSGTYNFYNYTGKPTEDSHTYGDVALVTRVAAYQQFIFTHIPELAVAIPEPASLSLLALGSALLTRRRRAA